MASRKALFLNQGFFEEVNTPTDKLDFAGNSTTDLLEGTNLYFTNARARSAISLTVTSPGSNTGLGSLAYNSSSGVLTFTQVTDNDVRTQLSATASTGISYTSSTGVFQLSSIPNASLTNSSITFEDARGNSTAVSLGGTYQVSEAENVVELVRNETGSTLAKGTPVAIVGYASGSNRPLVAPADANDSTKMPCIGLVAEQITNNANGAVIAMGVSQGYDTSSFTIGQTVYISTTPGNLTTSPPAGEASQIQNIGKVTKVDSNGRILVLGPGRSNATPNLDDGKVFVGNSSNQAVTSTLDTDLVSEGTAKYFTDARARGAISVTDSGGDGSLAYNSTSGVITYTGPSATEVRAHLSATSSTGITYSSSTGVMALGSIPNSSLTYSSITIGTTGVALGASATTLAGLTSVTSDAVLTNAGTGGIAIRDPSDATRVARFSSASITTGTTRTYTFPDEDGTLLTSASSIPGGNFVDNTFRISDNDDNTKKLAFECSGITASNTRTMTIPDTDGTISTESFATAIAVALG
jgi:hypothetical protein